MNRLSVFLCCLLLLSGCVTASVSERRDSAENLALKAGFHGAQVTGRYFTLQAYVRGAGQSEYPVVYIEGDGRAWTSRSRISPNPTPINPIGLKLAALDQRGSVIYLGRPCQYVSLADQPNCHFKYWTSHRFAPEVLSDYGMVLDQIKRVRGAKGFHLVGFSGGAAVAALLAGSRQDIQSLTTVAGNLDIEKLATHHKVQPLSGSLNPVDVAAGLSHVPQLHFVGGKDNIIPPGLTDRFMQKQAANRCLTVQIIPTATHNEGWEGVWKTIPDHNVICGAKKIF